MQLTPGLLTLLKVEAEDSSSVEQEEDEGKRKEGVERLLGKKDKTAKTGMEWGSICVFSCVEGCGGPWGEESVGIEWEE